MFWVCFQKCGYRFYKKILFVKELLLFSILTANWQWLKMLNRPIRHRNCEKNGKNFKLKIWV